MSIFGREPKTSVDRINEAIKDLILLVYGNNDDQERYKIIADELQRINYEHHKNEVDIHLNGVVEIWLKRIHEIEMERRGS